MSGHLSATDALLSLVAAETCEEHMAAFEALIESNHGLLRPINLADVVPVVGDGGAGAVLLGGELVGEHASRHVVVARRAGAVMRRHEAAPPHGDVVPDPFTEPVNAWAGVARW